MLELEEVLNRKLTRKQFLGYVGASVLAATGVASVIKSLGNKQTSVTGFGYGSGAYGGKEKR